MGSTTEQLTDLAAELEATRELPVDRTAARWVGEAEAVATDLTRGNPDAETVQRRVRHVVELLENVEETDNARADEHVRAAESIATDLLEELS